MNTIIIVGTVGLESGNLSRGTCTAVSGNGFGCVPSGMVNVVPAYTVTARPGIELNEWLWFDPAFCCTRNVSWLSMRGKWTRTGDTVTWPEVNVKTRFT